MESEFGEKLINLLTFRGFKSDYQLAREAANARGSGGVVGYLDDTGKLQPIKPKPQTQPKTPLKPRPTAKKSDGVVFKQKRGKKASGLDVDAFAKYMDEHAQETSQRRCAAAVRKGMEAGGLDTTGRPNLAGNYGPFLSDNGFTVVPGADGTNAMIGDIAVFNINKSHTAGHIQMWNGKQWVSDFSQKNFIPYRKDCPDFKVYRYGK